MSVPMTKEALRDRLQQLLDQANEAREQNRGYDSASDADYVPMLTRLMIANTAIVLMNDGLDLLGFGPAARLNRLFAGATEVTSVRIDSHGNAEVVKRPVLDPNDPVTLRVAAAYAEIGAGQMALVNGIDVVPEVCAVSADQVRQMLAEYEQQCQAPSEDAFTLSVRDAARRLVKGAHEDLVFIGEEDPPAPTNKIVIGEPEEGQSTVTFTIPLSSGGANTASAAPAKKKAGPLSYRAGLAAAAAEAALARFALTLSESGPAVQD